MKKLFPLLLPGMLLLAGSAEAQLQKGTRYWGGTISFNGTLNHNRDKFDKDNVSKTRRPIISPEAQLGWFVSDKVMLGVGLRYSIQQEKTVYEPSGYKNSTLGQSLQLLPFIRRYYSLGDRWALFIHGELAPSYSWGKSKSENVITETDKRDLWQYGLAVKPGVVYTFPNKKWSVEAYTNFLSLSFNYLPFPEDDGRQFTVDSGFGTGFPSYFSLRIARHLQLKN